MLFQDFVEMKNFMEKKQLIVVNVFLRQPLLVNVK